MTRIKICGITNSMEIKLINKYRPDYAGFVFAKSRRQVTAEQAARLGAQLLPEIGKVGVFVDLDVGLTADIAEKTGLGAVQLHGNEDSDYIEQLRLLLFPGVEIWKALRLDAGHLPEPGTLDKMDADRLLLDAYVAGSNGGTGVSFDWRLVKKLGTSLPIVLAGGLKPENVRNAIDEVSPFAVDTSSGVESDGLKDEQKLRSFMEAVRGGRI